MKKLLIGLLGLIVLIVSGCGTPSPRVDFRGGDNETRLKKVCDLNNGEACNNLGTLYMIGLGVKKDYHKSVKYHSKACSLNNGAGCAGLGSKYMHGWGVKQDYRKAVKYYSKSCDDLNFNVGCVLLGNLYNSGKGVKKDYHKAKTYYKKACKLGNREGCKSYEELKRKGY